MIELTRLTSAELDLPVDVFRNKSRDGKSSNMLKRCVNYLPSYPCFSDLCFLCFLPIVCIMITGCFSLWWRKLCRSMQVGSAPCRRGGETHPSSVGGAVNSVLNFKDKALQHFSLQIELSLSLHYESCSLLQRLDTELNIFVKTSFWYFNHRWLLKKTMQT